jgi:4-carboxymuconolactone decarboxylase
MPSSGASGDRRFGRLDQMAMTDEQRRVAEAILSGPRKSPMGLRGPFEALLQSPELADRVQRVGEHVRFSSSLPPALNEMAVLLTARRWTAQFEWFAHSQLALDSGLDPAVVDAIQVGLRPDLDTEASAVYEFTRGLLENGEVTDEGWQAVVDRWGKRGAIELIVTVGYYCLISFVLNVDRYPLPKGQRGLGPL